MAIEKEKTVQILLDKIEFAYNGKPVLKDLNLTIQTGDFVGILGPNGAGKSTLLRLMSHVLKPCSGRLCLDGKPLSHYDPRILARQMAVLPAEIFFTYDFTVQEIVKMGRAPYLPFWSEGGQKDLTIVENAMKATGVWEFRSRNLHALSSGERQMVFLAQAMTQEPKILLLDEPTVHLDIRHQIEIFQILKDWNHSGNITVVIVSHDINIASQFCRRLILMKDGKIVSDGPPQEVITEKNIREVYKIQTKIFASPETGLPAIFFENSKES